MNAHNACRQVCVGDYYWEAGIGKPLVDAENWKLNDIGGDGIVGSERRNNYLHAHW